MVWTPNGVTTAAPFGVGLHPACILVSIEEARPSKTGAYQRAWVATYRDTESSAEVEDWIKFDGSKKDYYSGLRIERLHAIIGAELDAEVNCQELAALSEGVFFTVEMKESKGKDGRMYLNIEDVRANDSAAGKRTPF